MLDQQALAPCNAIPTIEDGIKMLQLSSIDFSVPINDAHDDDEQAETIDTLQDISNNINTFNATDH